MNFGLCPKLLDFGPVTTLFAEGIDCGAVAFILTFNDPTYLDQFRWGNLSVLVPLVLLLSMLMISTIEFQAIPKPTRAFLKNHPRTAVAYAVGGVLILLFQETGLFLTLVGYIFINLGVAIYETIWE